MDKILPKLSKLHPRNMSLKQGLTILGIIVILPLLFSNFFTPNTSSAARLELTERADEIQIDIPNRYRAIIDKTGGSTSYLEIYDRVENDSNPDNTFYYYGPSVEDEGTSYYLSYSNRRVTTILENTASRVRIRMEGCLTVSAGDTCLLNETDTGVIMMYEDLTFTSQGVSSYQHWDFTDDGLNLDTTGGSDAIHPGFMAFNVSVVSHSETIVYGDGESEGTQSSSGSFYSGKQGYVVAQATGSYQDVLISPTRLMGDRGLSNGSSTNLYYGIDFFSEGDYVHFSNETNTQTLYGIGDTSFSFIFTEQSNLDAESKRQGYFNDFVAPDELAYTVGQNSYGSTPSGGIYFDGDSDYINAGSASSIDDIFSGGGSVSFWVNPLSPGSGGVNGFFFYKNAWRLYAIEDGDYMDVYLWYTFSGGFGRWLVDKGIPLKRWSHITVTYDNSSTSNVPTIYINGISQTVSTNRVPSGTANSDAADTLIIGSNAANGHAHGFMDDLRLYSTELSATEAQSLVYAPAASSTANLVAYWNLNEVTGTNVHDLTTNDNDGTLSGDATLSTGIVADAHDAGSGGYQIKAEANQATFKLDAADNASTLTNGAVSDDASSITVDATTGFDSSGFGFINGEKFDYTGSTGTTFTGIADNELTNHADNTLVAAMQRHSPMFEIQQWRSLEAPNSIALDNDILNEQVDYSASLKPPSAINYADSITFYDPMETSASTSPDIGGDHTENDCSLVPGRYGNGYECNDDGDNVRINLADNFNVDRGAIEFWIKPYWDHDDNTEHQFMRTLGTDYFKFGKLSNNDLDFLINDGGTNISASVDVLDYSWNAGEWVHLRIEWDASRPTAEQMFIYINGEKPTQSGDSDDLVTGLSYNTTFDYGNQGSATTECNCTMDEFYIFDSADTPSTYSPGSPTFAFEADDSANRAEYVYIGSDSRFTGLNFDLATPGIESSAVDFDWQYWDGNSWEVLTTSESATGACSFEASGSCYWDDPGNWFLQSMHGSPSLYYVRGVLESGSYSRNPEVAAIYTDTLIVNYQQTLSSADMEFSIPGGGGTDDPGDPPVAYWKFDEGGEGTCGNGADVCNSVSDQYHGTISGATYTDTATLHKALDFDGTDDVVTFSDDATYTPSGDMSFSVWFKMDELASSEGTDMKLVYKDDPSSPFLSYQMYVESSDNKLYFEWIDQGSNSYSVASVDALNASEWYHAIGVRDGTSLKLYVNGSLHNSTAVDASDTLYDSSGNLEIGLDGSDAFDGQIDEVKLYNYARSDSQVKTDYVGGSDRGSSVVLGGTYSNGDGPVAYYDFNENAGTTTVHDRSGTSNDATMNGSMAVDDWVPGVYGSGLELDGTDDYINMDGVANDIAAQNFTIAQWIKTTDCGGNVSIINGFNTSSSGNRFLTWLNGSCYFTFWNSTDGSNSGSIAIGDGNWHHVALVVNDTSNTATTYIDGVIDQNGVTFSESISSTDLITLGMEYDSGSPSDFFAGAYDDVRIYNYVRTQGQIIEDMNAGHPLGGSPVGSQTAYWKFDEGYGTTANDQSINGNTLTLSTASWEAAGKFASAWNGTGSTYLSRTNDDDFNFNATQDFTYSMWFKSDATANPGTVEYLVNKANATTAGYAVYVNNTTGQLCFGIDDDASWGPDIASCTTNDFYDNTWHHLVAVRDSAGADQTRIYIDGVLRDSDTDTTTATLTNSLSLYVGDRDGTNNGDEFNGDLDELKLYRAALTPEQVLIDYHQGSTVTFGTTSTASDGSTPDLSAARTYCVPGDTSSCAPPNGHWLFDDGTGTTVTDTSGGNNNLTFSGSPQWVPGVSGRAMTGDGVNDYAVNGSVDVTDLGSTGDLTISTWVYMNSLADDHGIVSHIGSDQGGDTDLNNYVFFINDGDKRLRLWWEYSGGFEQEESSTGLTAGTGEWVHIAVIRDATANEVTFYENGQQLGTVQSYTTDPSGGNGAPGEFYLGSNQLGDQLNGIIDDTRIYDYVRTPAQLQWDYNRGKPLAHWKFDDCQGTTAYDSSFTPTGDSNAHHGTITIGSSGSHTSAGACSTTTTSEAWANGRDGRIGASLDFDGTDDYVTVASPTLPTGDFSVGLWFNHATSGLDYLFHANDGSGGNELAMVVTAGNDLQFSVNNTNGYCSGGFTINTGTWYHAVVTRTGGTVTCYVDTKVDGTATNSSALAYNASCPLVIGADNDNTSASCTNSANINDFFDGQIDDVKIWNYGLTLDQVLVEYNDGAAVRFRE